MRLLIVSSVCLLLAATAVAQRPHPCRSPPFLTGSLSFIYPKGQLFVYEKFAYEALGRRVRSRLHGIYEKHPFHEDVLLLFREEVVYQISYANRTCTKRPLKMAFQPIEIPHNASLQAQVIIGSSSGPGQGLLVNNWTGEMPEEGAKYFLTFTEFGCVPITSLYHTNQTGWILTSFFNIMVGIEDPQDFIPPSFCDTTTPVDQGEEPVTNFFKALLKEEYH